MATKNIQFKRKSKVPKAPIIVLSVVAAAVIVAVAVLLVMHFKKDKEPTVDYGMGTFSTEGFEKVSDAKILGESLIIFTDAETGKKGIMKFLQNIRKDVFVDILLVPNGKDINDLTREEFLDECWKWTKEYRLC